MLDHHVHLGKDKVTGFSLDLASLSERIEEYQLDGAIIFPCPNNYKKGKNPYEKENNKMLDASCRDPRLNPFMFIHPFLDEISYLERNSPNFKGFKLHPRVKGIKYRYGEMIREKTVEFLIETRKPILFHTGYREGNRIVNLQRLFTRLKCPIALAHSGDLIYKDLLTAAQFENVYIDISPLATMLERRFFVDSDRRAPELAEITVDKILNYLAGLFGKDRILWGSDAPLCDGLSREGYVGEVRAMKRMRELGIGGNLI